MRYLISYPEFETLRSIKDKGEKTLICKKKLVIWRIYFQEEAVFVKTVFLL